MPTFFSLDLNQAFQQVTASLNQLNKQYLVLNSGSNTMLAEIAKEIRQALEKM
jgi:hypothetical protein